MKDKEKSIKIDVDLDKLTKFICQQYKLKDYESNQLIYQDYDNFSYVINCKDKKYFVRVYNNKKDEKDIQAFIENYRIIQKGVKRSPKILKGQGKEVLKVVLDNQQKVYVIVYTYLEGNSLMRKDRLITKEDIDKIIKNLNKLKGIELTSEIKNISFTNLRNSLKQYNEYIPNKWNQDISMCLDTMKRLNYKEMNKQVIHGDLHLNNMIEDDKTIDFVDYQCTGISYRLIDVVRIINNVIYTMKNTKVADQLYDYFLTQYQKENPLTETEKKALNVLVIADCYNNLIKNKYLLDTNKNDYIKYWYKNDLKVVKIFKKKI